MSELNFIESLKQTSIKSKEYTDASFGAALKGETAGAVVALDDVSPLAHKVGVKLRGKNLFDVSKVPSLENSHGVSCINNGDGSITIRGYAYNTFTLLKELAPQLKAGDTAILTAAYDNEPSYKAILMSNANFGWNFGKAITITEEMLNSNVYMYGNRNYTEDDASTIVTLRDIQIEVGTTATTYTPYVADDTGVTLTVCEKNILPYPYYHTTRTHYGVTFTDNGDGTITANGTANGGNAEFVLSNAGFISNSNELAKIAFAGCPNGGSKDTYYMLNTRSGHTDVGNGYVGRINIGLLGLKIVIKNGVTVDNLVFKPQMAVVSDGTASIPPYEPYKSETIITTIAEGAELPSVAPNMTIFTDNAGVVVEAEYNRDSNKVIEKLTQAIISLGGNI